MYDYGWRQYMPDLGKWNGMDQLSENYLSTSPYAYVANNPVSYADVDGRWFDQDGHIFSTAGQTFGFMDSSFKPKHATNFLGINPGDGGGGGYTFSGNAASSMFEYFANGGSMSEITFDNGWAKWWTDYNDPDTDVTGVGHLNMWKLSTNSWWDNFIDHFVFKTELSGSIGVQVGAKIGGPLQANIEAGILSTDIGKMEL